MAAAAVGRVLPLGLDTTSSRSSRRCLARDLLSRSTTRAAATATAATTITLSRSRARAGARRLDTSQAGGLGAQERRHRVGLHVAGASSDRARTPTSTALDLEHHRAREVVEAVHELGTRMARSAAATGTKPRDREHERLAAVELAVSASARSLAALLARAPHDRPQANPSTSRSATRRIER